LEPDYVGVNLTITAKKAHDLGEEFNLQANPTSAGWQYSESLANGGSPVGPMLNPNNYAGSLPHWVEQAWRMALSRSPSEMERKSSVQLIQKLAGNSASSKPLENPPAALAALPSPQAAALAKFCLALFNLDEFVYVE